MLAHLTRGIPRWLSAALEVAWDEGIYPGEIPGLDHVRTYKDKIVISQPYIVHEEIVDVLTKLVKKGIRFRIWGISPYFPGHTFSVVLWRAGDEDVLKEILEKMLSPFQKDDGERLPSHRQWV